jgi:hypothetical protein
MFLIWKNFMHEISLNLLESNRSLIETYVLSSHKKTYDLVEAISGDEGIGSASLFILKKGQAKNYLEAFIVLSTIYLCHSEQWELPEELNDNARAIIDDHLWRDFKCWVYEELSSEDTLHQIIGVMEGYLQLAASGSKEKCGDSLVKVYFNNNRVLSNLTVQELGISNTGPGICLSEKWNGKEFFYCTDGYYGFFAAHISG